MLQQKTVAFFYRHGKKHASESLIKFSRNRFEMKSVPGNRIRVSVRYFVHPTSFHFIEDIIPVSRLPVQKSKALGPGLHLRRFQERFKKALLAGSTSSRQYLLDEGKDVIAESFSFATETQRALRIQTIASRQILVFGCQPECFAHPSRVAP